MALRTEEKEIGGRKFEVTQLAYFEAQRLFVRLLRLAGPALTGLLQVAGKGGAQAALLAAGDIDTDQLAPQLGEFFSRLDPEEAESLTKKILSTTRTRQGDKMLGLVDHIDTLMGGDFWGVMALQAFALSVHFGNFNSARDALAALGLKAKASPSAGSTTSTDSRAEA